MTTTAKATTPTGSEDAGAMSMVGVGPGDAASRPRILGLRCRACGHREPTGPSFVCVECFGPLEVDYDREAIRAQVSRAAIEARPAGIWRYLELLPVEAAPARSLAVGSTPLVDGTRLAAELGIGRLWLKDDTRNPSLSFKDRVVALGAARAVEFGFDTLACASTGNLAGATSAAAAALGLRAFVFVPADLEPSKVDHALAYGATVVRVAGTYDEINRLSLEIADEEGWAFVNVNLRPYYSEGSKTLAFEIAEGLGWRLPDAIVGPIASGSLFTKVARGFDDLVAAGLVEARPVRFVGGQPAGCSPVATAFDRGLDEIEPVRVPNTFVRSLAIGAPADGRYALELARQTGGSIEAVPDEATAAAIRQLASTEGMFAETAAGVTVAVLAQARRRGVIRPDDEVVALITGNGLKTPDARRLGLVDGVGANVPPVIDPTYRAFDAWHRGAAA